MRERRPVFNSNGRWALLIVLASALLLLGHYDELVRSLLTRLFTGSAPVAAPSPATAVAGGATFTTRNVPAMLAYGLLYVGLSIGVLHLALNDWRKTRLVVVAYGGTMALIGVLLVAGRVLGLASTLTPVARELIGGGPVDSGGLLSPLPILLLLAIFRLAPGAELPPAET